MARQGGGTRPSLALRKTTASLAALAACVALAAGCGGGEGVASGATVSAYVEASLCAGAKEELGRADGKAGDVRVRAICLPSSKQPGKLDLATVGANARRATEDSTAVAYLEAPDTRRAPFTHSILEAAQIPWVVDSSGIGAMAHLLKLIEAAGPGSLRAQVREELEEPSGALLSGTG